LNKKNNHIEILNKPCVVCHKLNRFHKIFYCADNNYYVRQQIDKDWNDEPLVTDHYAIIDNLMYLEYMENKKNAS